ncbi:MAG: hypothetical protein FGM54_11740, partial [Chitinophagaceae bacterium]|nr:hypothetical protein [Chitinophagaceae bacterium]
MAWTIPFFKRPSNKLPTAVQNAVPETSALTELLKKVRHIEIKTKGLSNHVFSGAYHSAFKG